MSKSESEQLLHAAALKYEPEGDRAPVIVASGAGYLAQRIIDIAQNNGVSVYHDDNAATLLSKLALGASIPQELYTVIAEIYVSVIRAADAAKAKQPDSTGGIKESID